MRKTFLQLALVLILSFTAIHLTAFAGSLPNVSSELFKDSQLPAPAEDQTGQEIVKTMVFAALGYVKTITAVLGILMITLMAYRLIALGDNEEEVSKAKRGLMYSILAFVLVSMAEDIGKIFDMTNGTILQSPQEILNRVRLFDRQVEIVISFSKYIIGAFATFMFVRAGIKMIAQGAEEEERNKAKQNLLYTSLALVLVFVGDIFINQVFYKVNKNVYSGITGVHPGVDAKAGVEQIVGITNFIVSFLGPIAVLVLLAGAVMYATSRGEEEQMEKAKRLVTAAALGIIMIFGAFALVSTFVSGQLQDLGAIAEDGSVISEQAPANPIVQ